MTGNRWVVAAYAVGLGLIVGYALVLWLSTRAAKGHRRDK
jgi:uncharacterized membrane protein